MCVGENNQCARHVQVEALGFRAARLVIDEQFVGVEKLSQGQGRSFARIVEAERGIGGRVRRIFEPCRSIPE